MIDALGHPIRKGDKVLTGVKWSPIMNIVTEVVHTTKTYVYVELLAYRYDHRSAKYIMDKHRVRRSPHQVVVVNQQLKHNIKTYPENAV